MTAEIFLATFLASLTALAVTCVFFKTVYLPVQRYLMQRAWKQRLGNPADFVSVGADYVPPPAVGSPEIDAAHRQFEAQQILSLAALDIKDAPLADNDESVGRLVIAARAFRRATTPRVRKQMRAMAAFRKVHQETDDSV